jgi:hypothetical protein
MPAYGGPRYTIVQLLHRMWPRRSTIAELMPHCATPGEFSASHHPEGPSPGSLKNITPLTFNVQVAYTALSHGSYTIEERLARWLLMCHDRVDGDDLPLVHEFLSMMLGVRRPGVTIAVQTLEATGIIKAKRGHIIVQDRARLEEVAGGSYGVPEAEYRRLFGQL